jgi:DNA-binding transcriptional LysR family regulator
MHIRSLKIFCDIVDHGSFSQAAKANGVSQSNASQVVHQLEERLGVQLIDRSKRPFVLTPEGERFHEGSRGIVERYDELERQVRSLHDAVVARLNVASIYSVGLAHMSQYMREFLGQYPQADVRLEYLHPQRVYEVVACGDADLGLVSFPEESRHLATISWRSEPMVIVCHPEHRLAGRRTAPLETLRGEAMIAFQRGLRIRDEIDHALALRHVEVDVALEFDNIETIKRAIEIDAGVSVLPAPTVAREVAAGTLAEIPLAGQQLSRPIGIIHRRDHPLGDMARKFVNLLLSHASGDLLDHRHGDVAVRRKFNSRAARKKALVDTKSSNGTA